MAPLNKRKKRGEKIVLVEPFSVLILTSMDSQVTIRGNRLPHGAIEEMMARAADSASKNGTLYLSESCLNFLQAFKFPTFEILVTFQVFKTTVTTIFGTKVVV